MQVMERCLKHAVDDWAWSICGCKARCDECEPLDLRMIGFCQSVYVRHSACSMCLWMIGLGRSVDAKHGAWSGCLSMFELCRSVDQWMQGTARCVEHSVCMQPRLRAGCRNACGSRPMSTCLSQISKSVVNGSCDLCLGLSAVGLQGNQGLSMRTSTRICPSCSFGLIRASLVLSRSVKHAHS